MLRILGSRKALCDGIARREFLQAGGLGVLGLSLADYFRLQEVQAAEPRGKSFGRAKACILLYLYGAPSQLELCDMKPSAPVEIRGELKPIRSSLPGLDVCELMPNAAKIMDRVTVVRSMSHPYPIHGVAYATTGVPQIEVAMELNPRDARHWPFIGSVVDYLHQRQKKKRRHEAPDNIALPFPFSSQRVGEVPRAGPYAAFLGGGHHPIWTQFKGEATATTTKTLRDKKVAVKEPYMGITPASRFELAGATQLPADITLDRLQKRRSLLEQFEKARADLEKTAAGQQRDRFREMAYNLIGSSKVREALDLGKEPLKLRESYGMTLFGQAALTARRLVEAGSRFVSVFWDEYGLAGSAWDTHWQHFPRLKNELMPGFDQAFYGLIHDLDSRGLLEETLVMCISEHGRTPKLKNNNGGGRDHWSRAYTCLFAGGGIARGKVVGKTDSRAAEVVDRPVSPKDVLATAYYLLGLDPHTILRDRTNRPLPLVDGEVVQEMLA
ncbi:MAG: hypothetical protein KatS3mg105_1113 [Gemmatales bacterium]|nr:MAG: hypothetical protein KatS3mg105_1113 [Gemmatales bacterium]